MIIRKATEHDIVHVSNIFEEVHSAEEEGRVTIGWIRDVYPTAQTAKDALKRADLFVAEDNGKIVGTAIINQRQVEVYEGANWEYDVKNEEIMVLHTLVISPQSFGNGYGAQFVAFYEEYARAHGCNYLRMDTNQRNAKARALYKKLGYKEIGIVPCTFNGIEGVQLVLLEKKLMDNPI